MEIKIKIIEPGIKPPESAYDGDAGVDLSSRINIILKPGERAIVPTGIALEIPEGYAGFLHPRSGLAIENGLSIVNAPGLIDSHYRGEVSVILINLDPAKSVEIKRGKRIAQLVVQKVEKPAFRIINELNSTERGEKGFGSSGK